MGKKIWDDELKMYGVENLDECDRRWVRGLRYIRGDLMYMKEIGEVNHISIKNVVQRIDKLIENLNKSSNKKGVEDE